MNVNVNVNVDGRFILYDGRVVIVIGKDDGDDGIKYCGHEG